MINGCEGNLDKKYRISELIEQGVLVIGDGYRAKNSELTQKGIPFARAGNINNGDFLFDRADYFPPENLHKVGEKVSQVGDVVFTSKGTVGRFAYVTERVPRFVYSPQLCFWRSKNQDVIQSRYLYYWMQSKEFLQQMNAVKSQTDMADYVSLSDQRKMYITVPSIKKQEAISFILGSLDDKIELNRRMNETLEQMAMALYKHWFVDFGPFQDGEFVESEMGMIPQGWTVKQLGDLVSIQTSSVNPAKYEENLFLHYSIPAYDEKMRPKLEKSWEIKSNKYLIKQNSILVSKLNPETYRIWTVFAEPSQYERICSTEFIVYEPKNENAWAFLNAYFRDDSFINEFRSHAAGTTGSRQRVTPRKTLEFKLVVSPDSVLEQFNRICSDFYEIQNKNLRENEVLTEIRDYLLPRLLSGEIELREAEEQVEEVLANA